MNVKQSLLKAGLVILGTTLSLGLVEAKPAQALEMFTLNSDSGFRNDSWSFGEIFTPNTDIEVTSLGAYDNGGNGFATPGGIPVGIFRESDNSLLSSTLIQSTDQLINKFRYQTIAPILLNAGEAYRVVGVNRDDVYNVASGFSVNSLINRTGHGYCRTGFLTSCNQFTGSDRVWMANFQANEAQVVPAPAAVLPGLFGMGMAAIRKRKQTATEEA